MKWFKFKKKFAKSQAKPTNETTATVHSFTLQHALNKKLYKAVKHRNLPNVIQILNMGGNPNFHHKSGYTPLYKAVMLNEHEIAQALIGFGASVDLRCSHNGNTPLHAASKDSDLKMMEEVLKGANPDLQNKDGNTPLHLAVMGGEDEDLETVQSLLYFFHANPNITNNLGQAPIHLAAEADEHEMIQELLAKGAIVDLSLPNGETVLHSSTQKGHLQIIDELFTKADANKQNIVTGDTPMHTAVREGDLEALELFLMRGGNPNIVNHEGESPLHLAAEEDEYEMIQTLLAYKANIDLQRKDGQTALHRAVRNRHLKIVDELFRQANPNIAEKNGKATPLHIAVDLDDLELVEAVLFIGADPNQADENGDTALHLAVRECEEDLDLVNALLDEWANPNLPNLANETPIDIAMKMNRADIAKILSTRLESASTVQISPEIESSIKMIKQYLRLMYQDYLNKKFTETMFVEKLESFIKRSKALYKANEIYKFAHQCATYLLFLTSEKVERMNLPAHLKTQKEAFIDQIDKIRREFERETRLKNFKHLADKINRYGITEEQTDQYPALRDTQYYGLQNDNSSPLTKTSDYNEYLHPSVPTETKSLQATQRLSNASSFQFFTPAEVQHYKKTASDQKNKEESQVKNIPANDYDEIKRQLDEVSTTLAKINLEESFPSVPDTPLVMQAKVATKLN